MLGQGPLFTEQCDRTREVSLRCSPRQLTAKGRLPTGNSVNEIVVRHAKVITRHRTLMPLTALAALLRDVALFHALPDFEERERQYKLRVANRLRLVRSTLLQDGAAAAALHELRRTVKSPDQNFVYSRDQTQFNQWTRDHPDDAAAALRDLWAATDPVHARVARFSAALASAGLRQPASQLTIASVLLMAISAYDYPPIRTAVFNRALLELGYAPFSADAADRYVRAIHLLDDLLVAAPTSNMELRDRLDAQSILWCAFSGNWDHEIAKLRARAARGGVEAPHGFGLSDHRDMGMPATTWAELPPGTPPATHAPTSVRGDTSALSVWRGEDHWEDGGGPETERAVLALARRGQGRYRDDLIALWGGCAVTGCEEPALLRASHLKPWKVASACERLDPYNGLLLTPTLDAALDRGLISFTDDGRMLVAEAVSEEDRRRLGLNPTMRMRRIANQHLPYLAYHRREVFLGTL
jgi:hypothetical protein